MSLEGFVLSHETSYDGLFLRAAAIAEPSFALRAMLICPRQNDLAK